MVETEKLAEETLTVPFRHTTKRDADGWADKNTGLFLSMKS